MEVNFCGACGAPLPSKSAKMCVKCGSDPRISENYCPSCGEKLKSKGAIMCIKCGAPLGGSSADKDPTIAALISVICMLFLGAPAVGYFYLGKVKKGIILLLAGWAVWIGVIVVYIVMTFTIIGAVICLPIFLVPLIVDLALVYDVYLDALGKPMIAGIRE